ncbi:hypothetical protein TRFO_04358 [Tritrichomonas foetus]|uniref:Uncharacterized protein n=1 Tax=Tritrichomonas foetus TaxID=1144522 RepID=A0A1J4KFX5_9EUKA|nr:hypothetical protein TRFO_04358 [Tritrichomonas foetus]|eukprot:OHT10313.1 hypothetical protein TRFO_04358 [Tritrichomonas foetus]
MHVKGFLHDTQQCQTPTSPKCDIASNFSNAEDPIDIVNVINRFPRVKPIENISDDQMHKHILSELEWLNEQKNFLKKRSVDSAVDSLLISSLLPFSNTNIDSKFLNEIAKKNEEMDIDSNLRLKNQIQKKMFLLSIGKEKVDLGFIPPQPKIKPILVKPSTDSIIDNENGQNNGVNPRKVHFIPEKGDVIPPNTVAFNPKKEMLSIKSNKKNTRNIQKSETQLMSLMKQKYESKNNKRISSTRSSKKSTTKNLTSKNSTTENSTSKNSSFFSNSVSNFYSDSLSPSIPKSKNGSNTKTKVYNTQKPTVKKKKAPNTSNLNGKRVIRKTKTASTKQYYI